MDDDLLTLEDELEELGYEIEDPMDWEPIFTDDDLEFLAEFEARYGDET